MRNILLLQLETRVALSILLIVLAIFLFTLYRSMNNFNKFVDKLNFEQQKIHEEIRVEESP